MSLTRLETFCSSHHGTNFVQNDFFFPEQSRVYFLPDCLEALRGDNQPEPSWHFNIGALIVSRTRQFCLHRRFGPIQSFLISSTRTAILWAELTKTTSPLPVNSTMVWIFFFLFIFFCLHFQRSMSKFCAQSLHAGSTSLSTVCVCGEHRTRQGQMRLNEVLRIDTCALLLTSTDDRKCYTLIAHSMASRIALPFSDSRLVIGL